MATEQSTTTTTKKLSLVSLQETINQLKEVTDTILQKTKELESSIEKSSQKPLDEINTNSEESVNSKAVVNYIEERLTKLYSVIAKDICAIQDGKDRQSLK